MQTSAPLSSITADHHLPLLLKPGPAISQLENCGKWRQPVTQTSAPLSSQGATLLITADHLPLLLKPGPACISQLENCGKWRKLKGKLWKTRSPLNLQVSTFSSHLWKFRPQLWPGGDAREFPQMKGKISLFQANNKIQKNFQQ